MSCATLGGVKDKDDQFMEVGYHCFLWMGSGVTVAPGEGGYDL